jgi:hypothetical protein
LFLDEYTLQVTKSCAEELTAIRHAVAKIQDNIASQRPQDSDDAVKKASALVDSFCVQYGEILVLLENHLKLTFQGHIYATVLQLGGQLLATRSAESIAATSEESKRDAMKVSAALSFGTPFVSGSVKMSHETSDSSQKSTSSVQNASALSWSAQGGNTLLVAR